MPASYYVALGALAAVVMVVLFLRQRGSRQQADVTISAPGVKARVKTSVDPEMQRIKAGRDVKAIAGAGDPARMSDVDAGQDVIRDTTGRDPKV